MDSLLQQIRQTQPEFAKAVNERVRFKMMFARQQFSRSGEGADREAQLTAEGREIWKRTEPVIQAHKALVRAYLLAHSTSNESPTDGQD